MSKPRSSKDLPKPPAAIHQSAIISNGAVLTGTDMVTIGSSSVLHPHAKIVSNAGPVNIGRYCIVSERSAVGSEATDTNSDERSTTALDDYVVVESGAIVEASRVGYGSVIDVEVKIGRGAVIGKYCKISPYMVIPPGAVIPDYTIVYGRNQQRLDNTTSNNEQVRELRRKGHMKHIEMLRRLIPSNLAKWQ